MQARSAGILATGFGGSGDAMQKGSERAVSPQEAGSGLDGKPRATEDRLAQKTCLVASLLQEPEKGTPSYEASDARECMHVRAVYTPRNAQFCCP